MIPRKDIKGFTLKLWTYYIEFVFIKCLVVTIAINKGLRNKTYYLLDRGF